MITDVTFKHEVETHGQFFPFQKMVLRLELAME